MAERVSALWHIVEIRKLFTASLKVLSNKGFSSKFILNKLRLMIILNGRIRLERGRNLATREADLFEIALKKKDPVKSQKKVKVSLVGNSVRALKLLSSTPKESKASPEKSCRVPDSASNLATQVSTDPALISPKEPSVNPVT